MSTNITVTYKDNQINVNNKNNSMPNTYTYTDGSQVFSGSKLQYLLRKLDCLKDGKEGDGITNKTIFKDIFPDTIDNSDLKLLDRIKNKLFEETKNKKFISNDSWLKSSTCSTNYEYIKNIFYETGLGPEDYIVNFKNPSIKSFKTIGTFQGEIGDPGSRSSEGNDIWFPSDIGSSLIFDKSFMNYFGFGDTTYSSTLESIANKIGGTYNYTIDLGLSLGQSNSFSSEGVNRKMKTGDEMDRFIETQFGGNKTFQVCDVSYPLDMNVTANEYFKGNNYKNALINVLSSVDKNKNLPEIKRYLFAKEMGDVMQVLAMMVWQIYGNENKKNYSMITLDSIVYMLCILLEQPCIYTHNSNKGVEQDDKCYAIQIYAPVSLTQQERIKIRFDQKYGEISFNNLKIKNIFNKIFITGSIFIGKVEINFKESKNSNSVKNEFIHPLGKAFEDITKELEDFYNNKNASSDTYSEIDITKMHNDFFILPIFGVKGKKDALYYINPEIRNYTATKPYTFKNNTNVSFLEIYTKLCAGTLSNVDKSTTLNDVSIGRKRKLSGGAQRVVNNDNNFLFPSTPRLLNDSSSIINSSIPIKDSNISLDKMMNKPSENEVLTSNVELASNADETSETNTFTEKLFLTFINEVVNNLENLTNNLTLSSVIYLNNNESSPMDEDATYYYYYDMLVYISYIKETVFYEEGLLKLMMLLKDYSKKEEDIPSSLSIMDILNTSISNNIEEVTEDKEKDDDISECKINISSLPNKSSRVLNYVTDLLETIEVMKNTPLKSNEELKEDFIKEGILNDNEIDIDQPMEVEENTFNTEEEEDQSKMDIVTPPTNLPSFNNLPIENVDSKRSLEDPLDNNSNKKMRKEGGKHKKTAKRKRSKKMQRKTRGGSHTKKKRSIKKKASRRKNRRTRRRPFK